MLNKNIEIYIFDVLRHVRNNVMRLSIKSSLYNWLYSLFNFSEQSILIRVTVDPGNSGHEAGIDPGWDANPT